MKTEIVESLSLGIISSLKTVAFLDRGPEYPLVIAVSGWAFHAIPSTEFTTIISSSAWTDKVLF